jgi:hypothetical protein
METTWVLVEMMTCTIKVIDQISSLRYAQPFEKEKGEIIVTLFCIAGFEPRNQAPICKQASGDGSLGEYGGLWSQEDNMVIVI